MCIHPHFLFFFFNDTATTEIYTLSLHDALPIFTNGCSRNAAEPASVTPAPSKASASWGTPELHHLPSLRLAVAVGLDRKSTRLNSSHANISYAVFCLKKKINNAQNHSLENEMLV